MIPHTQSAHEDCNFRIVFWINFIDQSTEETIDVYSAKQPSYSEIIEFIHSHEEYEDISESAITIISCKPYHNAKNNDRTEQDPTNQEYGEPLTGGEF